MAEAEGEPAPLGRLDSLIESTTRYLERVGAATARGVAEAGFGAWLLFKVVFWIVLGRSRAQPVRIAATFERCMEVGIRALPIVTLMSITVGMMLAIQGIYSLRI